MQSNAPCIAVTGANGLVGRALCAELKAADFFVMGIVRTAGTCPPEACERVFDKPDFVGIDASPVFAGCDVVIHLAARVHVMRDKIASPLAVYRETNVNGTLRVAAAAMNAGARRFVFVSSVKVFGDNDFGRPWRESDPTVPTDEYGQSKREAEEALFSFGRETGLEVVVVRPPLVYGPDVRANFLQLMRAVSRGIPLPLGAVSAERSLVFVANLTDALIRCAIHPKAAGKIFHVSDGKDLTVPELCRMLGYGLGRPARLVRIPVALLRTFGRLIGREAQIRRLTAPLRVDISHISAELGWQPPHSGEEGLLQTVKWFRAVHRS